MENISPNKIKIERQIVSKQYQHQVKWSDIKSIMQNTPFEDDDIISIGHDEGYYLENNSWDPHYYIYVNRMIEETDKEFEKRIESNAWHKENMRKRRYENYLKLKQEFENE